MLQVGDKIMLKKSGRVGYIEGNTYTADHYGIVLYETNEQPEFRGIVNEDEVLPFKEGYTHNPFNETKFNLLIIKDTPENLFSKVIDNYDDLEYTENTEDALDNAVKLLFNLTSYINSISTTKQKEAVFDRIYQATLYECTMSGEMNKVNLATLKESNYKEKG